MTGRGNSGARYDGRHGPQGLHSVQVPLRLQLPVQSLQIVAGKYGKDMAGKYGKDLADKYGKDVAGKGG